MLQAARKNSRGRVSACDDDRRPAKLRSATDLVEEPAAEHESGPVALVVPMFVIFAHPFRGILERLEHPEGGGVVRGGFGARGYFPSARWTVAGAGEGGEVSEGGSIGAFLGRRNKHGIAK